VERDLRKFAQELGIEINPQRVVQLQGLDSTPELGYPFGKGIAGAPGSLHRAFRLQRHLGYRRNARVSRSWFAESGGCFRGRLRRHRERGLLIPSLTTVRQPLKKNGTNCAETLLRRIEDLVKFKPKLRWSRSLSFASLQPGGHRSVQRQSNLTSCSGKRGLTLLLDQEVLVASLEVFDVPMIKMPKPRCDFVDHIVVVRHKQHRAIEFLERNVSAR